MSVGFEQITEFRMPGPAVEVVPKGSQALNVARKKILINAIKLSTGTLAELTPTRCSNSDLADIMAGVGSPAAEMHRIAKRYFPTADLYLNLIDELSGGTNGTKTLTITGTTTAAGTLHLYIGGIYVPVNVGANSSPTTTASAIVTAFNAHRLKPRMAYTALSSSGVVTFTMRWKGVDTVDIRTNYQDGNAWPVGITNVAVAVGVAGAGNPDATELVDAMGAEKWHRIISQFSDATNMLTFEQALEVNYGGMVQREGHLFAAYSGSHANTTSYGQARNSKQSCVLGISTSPTPTWLAAAVFGTAVSVQPDPALPLHIGLPGILPPARPDRWDWNDNNALLYDGIAVCTWDDSGNCNLRRSISTYQTNAAAVEDPTWLDVEWKFTVEAIRYDWEVAPEIAFPRYKLAKDSDKLPPGQKIMTPATMKAFAGARWDLWWEKGWVDPSSRDQFVEQMIVEIDPADPNRLVGQLPPDIINQYRGMSTQLSPIT
jgi:phage tail sheath gpL-like